MKRAEELEVQFQYPEGFLPDSDARGDKAFAAQVKAAAEKELFQYPEGFLPDSDGEWDDISPENPLF